MKPTENGVYLDVSREDYDRIDRANWSTVKHLKRSPAHFRAAKMEKAKEDTDALLIGRAVGVATLEPERFFASHVVWDGGRRYGKDWDKFQEKNAGYEILTETQYQQVKSISEAARANEHAAKYLRGGSAEVTLLWTAESEEFGYHIDCKGRLDFAASGGAIVDLKTARDASPSGFCRASWNLGYHEQAAMYVDGYAATHGGELLPYVLIAVEKEAPYVVQVYRMPDQLLEMGRASYRALLQRLTDCRKDSRWPGYAEGELDLELPSWLRAENELSDLTGLDLDFQQEESANA